MFFLLRLCCATVSAYVFVSYLPFPAFLVFRLSQILGMTYEEDWYSYYVLKLKFSVAALWMATWALLELRNLTRSGRRLHRPEAESTRPSIATHKTGPSPEVGRVKNAAIAQRQPAQSTRILPEIRKRAKQ